jgi:integrase
MLDEDYSEQLDGNKLLIYVRGDTYYARVYRGGRRYIHKSLKTENISEARKKALRFLHEIEFKQQQDLPLVRKSFSAVIDEYVALRQRQYDRSLKDKISTSTKSEVSVHMLRQIKRVAKFWHAYCGKLAIEKIDNKVLQDYIEWRKNFYHAMPTKQRPKNARLNPKDKTLQWEMTLAKTIIKFAHERGYRGRNALPTFSYTAEKKIVRPAFSLAEYWVLIRGMRKWIYETDNEERRYTRELLRDYVLLLANSGMRVGEANNLKESDIEEFKDSRGRKNYLFRVDGKTGKRQVVPRTNAVRYVDRLLARNAKWADKWSTAKKKSKNRKTENRDEWLFRMPDGNKIITLIDQFKALLERLEIKANRDGEEYTLYSLRHFYAVMMLQKSQAGVYDIARNMGTSVQIIESYYGRQATPRALATKLGGGGR